ncbi:hypothetical protein DPMN_152677 [Dreissena polymorpha]|uniref:Uncharacterized protein n=1 Tax=Dreissena polymorpha TaxID=45954 RepID=A0A9D4FH90_DREPO|nr:hypothetical protein DPMN_152677 [Dreissena polymorpha]
MNPETIPFKLAMTNTAILHTACHDRTNVLLKTAVAEVLSQSHSSSANILLDERAQRSFITEDPSRVLHLPVTGHDTITLASFGGMSQGVRSIPTSEIYLKSETGFDKTGSFCSANDSSAITEHTHRHTSFGASERSEISPPAHRTQHRSI